MINSITGYSNLPQNRHTALNKQQTNQNLQFGTLKFIVKSNPTGAVPNLDFGKFIEEMLLETLKRCGLITKKIKQESGDIYTAALPNEKIIGTLKFTPDPQLTEQVSNFDAGKFIEEIFLKNLREHGLTTTEKITQQNGDIIYTAAFPDEEIPESILIKDFYNKEEEDLKSIYNLMMPKYSDTNTPVAEIVRVPY